MAFFALRRGWCRHCRPLVAERPFVLASRTKDYYGIMYESTRACGVRVQVTDGARRGSWHRQYVPNNGSGLSL